MFPYPFSFVSPQASGLSLVDNNFSMQFDAASETSFTTGIVLPDAETNDLTMACWLKTNTAGVYAPYFWAAACANPVSLSESFGVLLRTPFGSTDLKLAVGGTFGTTIINDGNWHFVMSVWEYAQGPAGRISYYVDGSETPELSKNVVSYYHNSSLGSPVIGDISSTSASHKPYDGYIDEWALWYSNQSDMSKDLYDATNDNTGKTADLSTLSTPPVAWYRMGD